MYPIIRPSFSHAEPICNHPAHALPKTTMVQMPAATSNHQEARRTLHNHRGHGDDHHRPIRPQNLRHDLFSYALVISGGTAGSRPSGCYGTRVGNRHHSLQALGHTIKCQEFGYKALPGPVIDRVVMCSGHWVLHDVSFVGGEHWASLCIVTMYAASIINLPGTGNLLDKR
jgi:hypothetical protein